MQDRRILCGNQTISPWTHMKRWLYLIIDIALWSSKFSCVLDPQVDYEEEIVPHVVVVEYVLTKCHVLVLETASG